MAKSKVITTKDGVKLYPVCGFQKSQHKLFYWYDKAQLNTIYADDPEKVTDKQWEEYDFWNEVIEYAHCVYNGLIYMPYKYYNRVKEAIVAYDLCH